MPAVKRVKMDRSDKEIYITDSRMASDSTDYKAMNDHSLRFSRNVAGGMYLGP